MSASGVDPSLLRMLEFRLQGRRDAEPWSCSAGSYEAGGEKRNTSEGSQAAIQVV